MHHRRTQWFLFSSDLHTKHICNNDAKRSLCVIPLMDGNMVGLMERRMTSYAL